MQHQRKKLLLRFDELASEYDKWYRTPLGSLSDTLEKEAVFSLAKVRQGELALDVSCGTGNYALELTRKRAKVIGIDSSKKMLEIAVTKAKKNRLKANFLRASTENLPFANETFDVVTIVLMLEFASSPQRVIEENLRVLKPCGRLIIGVLNKYSVWAFIRRLRAQFKDSIWKEAIFFDRQNLIKTLVKKECTNIRWEGVIYFPPINNRWLLKRVEAFEKVGQRLFPDLSVFLAVKCEKTKNDSAKRRYS